MLVQVDKIELCLGKLGSYQNGEKFFVLSVLKASYFKLF